MFSFSSHRILANAARREELELVRRGVERERKKLLKTVPVVGVTCCSSVLPVLDDLRFDVVVLDEASQMIEPISLLPIMASVVVGAAALPHVAPATGL